MDISKLSLALPFGVVSDYYTEVEFCKYEEALVRSRETFAAFFVEAVDEKVLLVLDEGFIVIN
jgi:hypothetical protein